MKAYIRVFGCITLLLAACLSCNRAPNLRFATTPEVEIDLEEIVQRGYINVLIDNNSISYFIYKGQPMGYEYELLNLFVKELKIGMKIQVTSGVDRAIDLLNKGEGDIVAFPLTVTKERTQYVSFTNPHFHTYQVLVQRKPEGWEKMTAADIEKDLIRNPVDLVGKEVWVLPGTSFELRLKNLSEEIGGDVVMVRDTVSAESESLIRKVALGDIPYTVADHMMAEVNAHYYPNLDIKTPVGVTQQVAWAVRKNAPQLTDAINTWLAEAKRNATFAVIYNRYFKSPRTSLIRMQSDYSSLGGNKLSPYDSLFKLAAGDLGWDWRLLASVVYQESRFLPTVESWAGARGLMQLMPATAKHFGVTNLDDPKESIRAGVAFLKYLDKYWSKFIDDRNERLKFVLASYNAGLTHVTDARKLAAKHGRDPNRWESNVEFFMTKKSDPTYYRDPVVVAGYCKCEEPVNYVKDVLERYDEYRIHIAT